MKKLIFVVILFTLIILACDTTSQVSTAVPYVQPTAVPYIQPTSIPVQSQQDTLNEILVANGFYRDSYVCSSGPCDSFTHDMTGTPASAITYPDGSLVFGFGLKANDDMQASGVLLNNVVTSAFGYNVTYWISQQLQAYPNWQSTRTVDGHFIHMKADTSDSLIIISIQ
jgi:hypothetical protein